MSRIIQQEYECNCCNKSFDSSTLVSTNAFGSSDLDLRPPEMQRSTMQYWIHPCPNCGYIDDGNDEDDSALLPYVMSEEYVSCEGNAFSAKLGISFYRYGMIQLRKGSFEEAVHAFLHAAWAFDDSKEATSARTCRNKAVDLFPCVEIDSEDFEIMKADVLRRAGRYQDVVDRYSRIVFRSDLLNRIIAFELEKARAMDDATYKVSDVIGEQQRLKS